jgi:catechol 2,3-dioxygenase-like lactoylglutathione lyase family enzyme
MASTEGETTMIGYVTLGTNDLTRAAAFYDALLGVIGGKRWMESERSVAWSTGPGAPGLSICKPFDGKAASGGNGTMIALAAADPAQVDAVYAKALSLGATDEGKPGLRGPTYYGAYFRDADGNKICAFHIKQG